MPVAACGHRVDELGSFEIPSQNIVHDECIRAEINVEIDIKVVRKVI